MMAGENLRILVINFGSTSTKVAQYRDDACVERATLAHDPEELRRCQTTMDQYPLRLGAIERFLEEYGIELDELDAIAARGGQTVPIPGGTWLVDDVMLEQTISGEYGHHVCNLGPRIAYELCRRSDHALPLTTDTPTTDEMDDIARYSGMPGIDRVSCVQALNIKAMSRYWAESRGRSFEDVRLVTVMLGGGIGVVGIRDGRMVDAPDGLEGEGPFSNNRCGTVPVGKVIKMCFDSGKTREQMIRAINGEAGLAGYLGTTDVRAIMERIEQGDVYAREVVEAMCYQTAKEIGAIATVLEGRVDAILLIGGMANVKLIVEEIRRRVAWIAPVCVMPGEREMEALASGALEAMRGLRPIQRLSEYQKGAR